MIDFVQANWIEIVGATCGIVYLYYEYMANIKMWPTGILMSIFYVVVFIDSKFYAFACINVYYILAAIYGWIKWKNSKGEDEASIAIVHTPVRYIPFLVVSTVIVFGIIYYILTNYTDSPVVYGDTIVTTLSIIAMWMLAQRYVEQWLLVIVLNVISVFLYFNQHLYPTSAMYLIYAIVSVLGYFSWKNKITHTSAQ